MQQPGSPTRTGPSSTTPTRDSKAWVRESTENPVKGHFLISWSQISKVNSCYGFWNQVIMNEWIKLCMMNILTVNFMEENDNNQWTYLMKWKILINERTFKFESCFLTSWLHWPLMMFVFEMDPDSDTDFERLLCYDSAKFCIGLIIFQFRKVLIWLHTLQLTVHNYLRSHPFQSFSSCHYLESFQII